MSNSDEFVINNGVLEDYHGQGGNVIIPDEVKKIGYASFMYCEGLTSVVIHNGVKSIGQNAFLGCTALKSIWRNSEGMNYLRGLRKKDLKECLSCDSAAFCTPCLVRLANESSTGNPLEISEYFCNVAAKNKEVVMEWIRSNGKDD